MEVPCYSARFISPFAQALSSYEGYAPESLEKLRTIDPASRISTAVANDLAVRQVADTGDPDLGFKAARHMLLGRAGALDYAMRSAASLRRAIDACDRYIRVFSDVLRFELVAREGKAMVRLVFASETPRPIVDFTMSALYCNHLRPCLAGSDGLAVWLAHRQPADTKEHERAFGGATLCFGADGYGFLFDRGCLDVPLDSADPALHAVLCDHLATALRRIDSAPTLAARAREIVMDEMVRGSPTVFTVARRLHMSARTLGRRLEREGTTFSALLEHLRRDAALRYLLHDDDATFGEISFRLGFSHVEAFHRAFKRWTGTTPLAYRRSRGVARA